jgi:hypothetical protein
MRFVALLSVVVAGMTGAAQTLAAAELKPFQTSYVVEWHGMTAGIATMTLSNSGPNLWSYRSSSEARGLFRLVISDAANQRSEMRLTPEGIQPLRYVADDGKASTERDIDLNFDWQRMRVTGTADGQLVDTEVPAGTQDDLSVQISLINELDNGRTPERFQTYGDRGMREFKYIREGAESLQTPLGNIATVVYRTERSGSPRTTRYWCAPSLGYLPMRAQQLRNDDVEWTMNIRTLQR